LTDVKKYLQKVPVISKKQRKNLFFVGILKANDEKSRIRIRIRIRKPVMRILRSGSEPKGNRPTPLDSSGKFDAVMNLFMHTQLNAGDSYLRERLSLLSRDDKLWRSFSETRGGNGIKLLLCLK
jgi:hypothetical protein